MRFEPTPSSPLSTILTGSASSFFGQTRWSLVARVGHDDPAVRQQAMAAILRRYLSPLRSYLICRKKIEPHRADDLLQEFIADKVLGAGILSRAAREKGKFRTYLLVALDRFVLNQIRDEHAAKRVPENGFANVGDEPAASDDGAEPGRAFDTQWARTVLQDGAGPDAGDVPASWPEPALERVPGPGGRAGHGGHRAEPLCGAGRAVFVPVAGRSEQRCSDRQADARPVPPRGRGRICATKRRSMKKFTTCAGSSPGVLIADAIEGLI